MGRKAAAGVESSRMLRVVVVAESLPTAAWSPRFGRQQYGQHQREKQRRRTRRRAAHLVQRRISRGPTNDLAQAIALDGWEIW